MEEEPGCLHQLLEGVLQMLEVGTEACCSERRGIEVVSEKGGDKVRDCGPASGMLSNMWAEGVRIGGCRRG